MLIPHKSFHKLETQEESLTQVPGLVQQSQRAETRTQAEWQNMLRLKEACRCMWHRRHPSQEVLMLRLASMQSSAGSREQWAFLP
jgi:hypothetical protein